MLYCPTNPTRLYPPCFRFSRPTFSPRPSALFLVSQLPCSQLRYRTVSGIFRHGISMSDYCTDVQSSGVVGVVEWQELYQDSKIEIVTKPFVAVSLLQIKNGSKPYVHLRIVARQLTPLSQTFAVLRLYVPACSQKRYFTNKSSNKPHCCRNQQRHAAPPPPLVSKSSRQDL